MKNKKGLVVFVLMAAALTITGAAGIQHNSKHTVTDSQRSSKNVKVKQSHTTKSKSEIIDFNKATGKHPDLLNVPASDLKIVVSTDHQTLSIYKDGKVVSTLIISTGKQGYETPQGNFAIQPQHGDFFYNDQAGINEGARNWISFKDNGVYLFHSVVMDKQNQPIMSRQGKLGHPNSHGCIQMSLPDNQWFYDTFQNKVGTPVIIEK